MRRHRQRRREGFRVVSLELHESEIQALVKQGMLTPDARNDAGAVAFAMYSFSGCESLKARKQRVASNGGFM
jgi:hypothetical protein